ncbi:hypothetical protein BH09ACT7_BH09ACT7_10120 [soil metagenome]
MRILVTAVTSDLGRDVARQLVAAGHRVSGIAAAPHRDLDPRVTLVCGELAGRPLQKLADAAEVVIHLAPVEAGVPHSAGIPGVVRVTHAAARAGARLLFPSHAAGDADLYRDADELVSSGWAPSLVIRLAPLVGRQTDWMVCRSVATILTVGTVRPIRVLHADDLHRFLRLAVSSHRTGVVDLATTDGVTLVTARRLLNEAGPRTRRIPVWPGVDPDFTLTPLRRDWAFECGWTAADAMSDTARGLVGRRLGAAGAIDLPGRGPLAVHAIVDDAVDVLEPLTPMTRDLRLGGLRAARRAAEELPTPPLALARHYGDNCAGYAAAAVEDQLDAATWAGLRDAALDVRIRLLGNRIQQGVMLTELGSAVEEVFGRLAGRADPPPSDSPTHPASGALVEVLRSDSELRGLAAAADFDAIRMSFPHFAATFDDVMADIGHLGPGATELAHPVFADHPAEILTAAALAAQEPLPADIAITGGKAGLSQRLGDSARTSRAQAQDTTARYLHQLRLALRELGARLVASGAISSPDDVFYLTAEEVLEPPSDARLRISRRRLELRSPSAELVAQR